MKPLIFSHDRLFCEFYVESSSSLLINCIELLHKINQQAEMKPMKLVVLSNIAFLRQQS